jgi:hypothetical protein
MKENRFEEGLVWPETVEGRDEICDYASLEEKQPRPEGQPEYV